MTSLVGHPSKLVGIATLEEFYSGFEIKPKEHFKSMYGANIFHNKRLFSKLKDKVNETEWSFHSRSTDANVYYGAVSCKEGIRCLIIPWKFLLLSCKALNFPKTQYMNFGAAGSVIRDQPWLQQYWMTISGETLL